MNEIVLGDVSVARVEEMHGSVGMTPDEFFPGSPDQHWDEQRPMLVPDHLDPADNIVQVAMQTWALRSDGRIILVDTGIGNDKTRPAVEAWDHLAGYLANLAAAGIAPEDVDLVINTHLHVDHVGWNTRLVDGEWVPTFPNATYLMPRADFEHWNPANNPNIAGGVNEKSSRTASHRSTRRARCSCGRTRYVMDANLTLRAAPGHTPGSSVLMFASGGDNALFAGDLMHTPLQVAHPEHNSCFCEDPATARETRLRLLGWAADHGALVLPAHFSGHSALEIVRDANAFAIKSWAPLPAY